MRKDKRKNNLTTELTIRYNQTGGLGATPPVGPTNHDMKFNTLDSGHGYNAFYVPLI